MTYRWQLAESDPALVGRLTAELRLSPLLARCLANRGLTEVGVAKDFLQPRLARLNDPFELPNMTAAVERLWRAHPSRHGQAEPLVIFGDYDVDGVTATALLTEVLSRLGWIVHAYLPHRLDEGYGLSQEGIENCLLQRPVSLLLAVDCGSNAVDSVTWLRGRGVDVIILDHHQVANPPPPALALVNPRVGRPASEGASSVEACATADGCELSAVGLAFKLAHALVKSGRERGLAGAAALDLREWLDLVALGTIADLVPLTGENRILVSAGLTRLDATRRPGLRALKEVAQVGPVADGYAVGFQLAPRLNAAGRLESATDALRLLLTDDADEAARIAGALDGRNRERQAIERGIADAVLRQVRAKFNASADYVIVEGEAEWHIGVVGIVASRVQREFYRPALIMGGDGAHWRGSGRSVEGFDLAAALRECADLLARHGGHAMAAGVTVRPENLGALRTRLNEYARQAMSAEQLQPRLRLDAEVSLAELTLERITELESLKPTGQGNPPVQVMVRGVGLNGPIKWMGREQQHARFSVKAGPTQAGVLWWNCADKARPAALFDLACAPQINEFNGRRSVELKVLDWRPVA